MEADLVKKLCFLNEKYAYMLMVLQGTELSDKQLNNLKRFLSGFCDDISFKRCDSLECVVEQLQITSKISLFNIEPLTACCRCNRPPLFVTEVRRAILNYKLQFKKFWSGISLKDFRCSLKERIHGFKGMAEVTLKLDDTAVNYTAAEIIKKLPYDLFGVSSKAMVLCEVRQGCVCAKWSVPMSLVPILSEKTEQLSPEYLASKGVLELVIGLRIVPNEG